MLGDTVPLGHNAFRWQSERTRKAAGVAQVRFYDLRHAFASALISGGCSVKAVQKALGHASAATTLNTYSHMWPGDEDRIRLAIDGAFGPAAEDQLRSGAAGE